MIADHHQYDRLVVQRTDEEAWRVSRQDEDHDEEKVVLDVQPKCECQFFMNMGLPCSHVVAVMQDQDLSPSSLTLEGCKFLRECLLEDTRDILVEPYVG